MHKRLVLIVLIGMAFFSGCSSQKNNETIVFLHSLYDPSHASRKEYLILSKYCDRFSKENNGINIKLVYKSFRDIEIMSRDPDSVSPIDYPDIMQVPHDQIGKYAESGVIQPFTDYMGKREDEFSPNALRSVKFNGNYYGFPIHGESVILVYRADIVTNTNVTIEDVVRIGKESGMKYPIVFDYLVPYYALPWIFGYGGNIFDKNGLPRVNTPETIKAFEEYSKVARKRLKLPRGSGDFHLKAFINGESPFYITGPWHIPSIRSAGVKIGTMLLPELEDGKRVTPFVGYKALILFRQKRKEHIKAIYKFLDYLMKSDFVYEYCMASVKIPALKRVMEKKEIQQDELISSFYNQIQYGIPMNNTPKMSLIWSYLNEDIFEKILYSKDIKKELDIIQSYIDEELKKGEILK